MPPPLAGLLCATVVSVLAGSSFAENTPEAQFLQDTQEVQQKVGKPKLLGGHAKDPAETSKAELINLLDADFTRRPELLVFVAALNATFQIFDREQPSFESPPPPSGPREGARPRQGVDPDDVRARPPADEGGPDLWAGCSASYIGSGKVLAAKHCEWGLKKPVDAWVLRRHRFDLRGGKLVRVGYEDFKAASVWESPTQDLIVIELAANNPPLPEADKFNLPAAGGSLKEGRVFHALGYPHHLYAAPHVSFGCKVLERRSGQFTYSESCTVLKGMSGGPHFMEPGRVQIGVTSQPNVGAGTQELADRPPKQ